MKETKLVKHWFLLVLRNKKMNGNVVCVPDETFRYAA